ncbi:MAG: K(+)-transporting ATPase subunit F [Candidatus Fermentithermobacillus carboniphilus]|uniref:K(+)-transporting ATPase subunit F n=1 Tax=Candidatus Fermentithermobacillus carboniphilus TaxID=3085328 RepID=A0AAT9LD85_9FIRM|nr:MAG: K(+)-transporting ATPase subunit F [Candidatus Fermentithermobacillus carboniphilus]
MNMLDILLGAVVSIGLFIYLIYTLMRAEEL